MDDAVRRRPLTSEARFRSRLSVCGICGEQNATGAGFSSSTLVFPCQDRATNAPYSTLS